MKNLRALALIGALALVVGACGDTGPTTAPNGQQQTPALSADPGQSAATATPAATPEPTPVDVAAATTQWLADTSRTARVKVDAQTTLGKVTTVTKGTIDIDGRASHLVRTDTVGRTKVRTETITANGERYAKVKGVWTDAGPTDDTELIAVLRGISSLEDLGVEDKDGQQLHHLQAQTAPGVPRELALASKGVSEVSSTLDVWATEDGTPVTMTMTTTWKQVVGKRSVKGNRTATFAIQDVAGDITVSVPTDVWAFYASKRYHYSMAHPVDWEVRPGTKKLADGFFGPDAYVYASRAGQVRATLSFLTSKIPGELKSTTSYTGIKITSNRKATLDGVPARRIEYRGKLSGKNVYGQATYAVKGAYWYFVGMDSYTKTDKAMRSLFTSFIRTFDFR